MTTPSQRFDSLLAQSDFLFIVFYRGQWCPFCMSYLKSFQAITDDIVRAGGTPFIVTSEAEQDLQTTRSKTGYNGKAFSDPENRLVKELKSRDLVNVAVSARSGYPNGMAQPAVLVIKKDGTRLFSWAINPSAMNLGGAKDRVAIDEVWEDVQGLLKGTISKPRENYSKQTIFGTIRKALFG